MHLNSVLLLLLLTGLVPFVMLIKLWCWTKVLSLRPELMKY